MFHKSKAAEGIYRRRIMFPFTVNIKFVLMFSFRQINYCDEIAMAVNKDNIKSEWQTNTNNYFIYLKLGKGVPLHHWYCLPIGERSTDKDLLSSSVPFENCRKDLFSNLSTFWYCRRPLPRNSILNVLCILNIALAIHLQFVILRYWTEVALKLEGFNKMKMKFGKNDLG